MEEIAMVTIKFGTFLEFELENDDVFEYDIQDKESDQSEEENSFDKK